MVLEAVFSPVQFGQFTVDRVAVNSNASQVDEIVFATSAPSDLYVYKNIELRVLARPSEGVSTTEFLLGQKLVWTEVYSSNPIPKIGLRQ